MQQQQIVPLLLMNLNLFLNIVNGHWNLIIYKKEYTYNVKNIVYTTLCNEYKLSAGPQTK